MQKDIKVLSERAMDGDAGALIELSQRAELMEDDEQFTELVDAFDRVAIIYAMGGGADDDWIAFKSICRKYDEMVEHQRRVKSDEDALVEIEFEKKVLAAMRTTQQVTPDAIDDEIAINPSLVFMLERRRQEEEQKADFCERWIEAAKSCLTEQRFVKLPPDVMDELIEVVSDELFSDSKDEGFTDDGSGHLADDGCIICQETEKAKQEGRSMGESELREVFRRANDEK